MKKLFITLAALFVFALPSFSQSKNGNVLVAYFSRADENYGVGYVSEGNTAKIAKIIAQKTGADLFEIKTQKDNRSVLHSRRKRSSERLRHVRYYD